MTVRLMQSQAVTPTMVFATAVDPIATTASGMSQDREKERNTRPDASRQLVGGECGLKISGPMVFMDAISFCSMVITEVG
ncbi:hypothetical protein OKA05_26650 [Luteolibacter arcticus]|uniref:Uncharacterized protein n=1 Tax=Luteolibacter arcticus TaxID=1581411 RepID=A0ABT3GRL0_9BACT|nr:hypothetical protein [Luteolibacter arcticus]MCW1926166.1 hypothetical protein [Luteolibacter arcticus]